MRHHAIVTTGGVLIAIVTIGLYAALRPGNERQEVEELAGYATGLRDRSPSQRHNARLAANALHGAVVRPGATFSFTRRVGNWTADAGYRKAPVSYEGRLVSAFGGGVCQVSSTLYNAVLLAGLPIVERHPHTVAPTYAPPGRDAAVAHDALDLRFVNSTATPIRIEARASGPHLTVRLLGGRSMPIAVRLESRILSHTSPRRIVWAEPQRHANRPTGLKQAHGQSGLRVVTYRIATRAGEEIWREKISDDTYKTVDQVWFLEAAAWRPSSVASSNWPED